MKFFWKEIGGRESVAKLYTLLRRALEYSPHIFFWVDRLSVYSQGMSTENKSSKAL